MRAKPNKAGLVRLLRSRGVELPSIRAVGFEALWKGMALCWADRAGRYRTAYLYMGTASPVLQIGSRTEPVTAEELARFGLIEAEKEETPGPANAETEGHHENMIMIPQFAELCKG